MTVATASSTATSVVVSQSGAKGLPGTNGTNGTGLDTVRKAKLDNPLCWLFKRNNIDAV